MHYNNPNLSFFAYSDYRNENRPVSIQQSDRAVSMYILGKSGSGKTNLMEVLSLSDISHGRGVCIIDIHGDMVKKVYRLLRPEEREKCIYLDIADENLQWGYNPLRKVRYEKRHIIASHILETFQKIWGASNWGNKQEHVMRNILLCLLDQQEMSFSDITKILTDELYRNHCVRNIQTEEVKRFWLHEFPRYTKSDLLPIFNKISSFLTIPCVKRVLVENKKQISLHSIMNDSKILLVDLSKGVIGADTASLLGSLILGGISASAYYRGEIDESERKPFYCYIDEMHNYTTLALANSVSEARKFGLSYVFAHQYLSQLQPQIRDSILGNIPNIICFRLAFSDAKYMANEFYPVFTAHDFINLENYQIYLKMMINGKPCQAFSAVTIKSSW